MEMFYQLLFMTPSSEHQLDLKIDQISKKIVSKKDCGKLVLKELL